MTASDVDLVKEAAAGLEGAAERLLDRIAETVRKSCRLVTSNAEEAEEAFTWVIAALQADGFARLRAYDGRSRLETFVALVTRDLLARRLLDLLQADTSRGWRTFEAFFQCDIRRIVARRLPGTAREEDRRDACQDIWLSLIEDDYRRLKSYTGAGSFSGFVLHTVDRLACDFARGIDGRRRLPAAIQRLPPLAQEVFRQVHWQRCDRRPEVLAQAVARQLSAPPDAAEVTAALEAVTRALPPGYDAQGPVRLVSLPEVDEPSLEALGSDYDSPDEIAMRQQTERLLAVAAAVIRQAEARLNDTERLYLNLILSGDRPLPAREVARMMGLPVETVHKLRPRLIEKLKKILEDHPEIQALRTAL